jgi:hypothetical protein
MASDEVTHGTINIVFGNRNGIVVLTDSMVSRGEVQLKDPGEKLFQLDDRSVCAVAGVLTGPAPQGMPDLFMTTATVIRDYAVELKSKPPQTIFEKVTSLAFILDIQLFAISTLQGAAGLWGSRASHITVAGFDPGGRARVGQVKLRMVRHGYSFRSEVEERSIIDVGKPLVWKLAGIDNYAEALLRNPELGQGDPTLEVFSKSMRENQGRSMTLFDLKALASRLTDITEERCKKVGGQHQVAELRDSQVFLATQPIFPTLPKALRDFSICVDVRIPGTDPAPVPPISEGALVLPKGIALLFVRTTFVHVFRPLDGNYFFDCSFEDNCHLRYDGGPFFFESNRVKKASLIIGPTVDPDDPAVQMLKDNFQWNGVSILRPA